MNHRDESPLLDDIAYLKAILHQVLEEQVGKKLLKVIEDLITLSLLPSRYSRTPLLSRKLSNAVKNLNLREAGQIIQAYAINVFILRWTPRKILNILHKVCLRFSSSSALSKTISCVCKM